MRMLNFDIGCFPFLFFVITFYSISLESSASYAAARKTVQLLKIVSAIVKIVKENADVSNNSVIATAKRDR